MTSQTSWIPVLMTFLLLLHFWRAKVYASGNSEEIDFTYLIIGVTLGAFLAIAFIAVIICMIKKQMLDHVFRGQTWDQARTEMTPTHQNSKVQISNDPFPIDSYPV
ncbi:transmembrane protein 273 isoform X1 [Phasianus colchicus]|uniref:transmembrane protein 273 isoform X1 n=1 Tax=Phasianus colchicus TaxID=9054 RepID=UPI00129E0C3C|nr:transmembrane protein 273 isoform X1 [Phasianus colchicus]